MSKQQSMRHVRIIPLLGRFWTIPNMLSLARLILIVPITYLVLVDGSLGWMLGLIAAAILTDWLDGRVARWSKTVSAWGKVLDPLADKFGAAMIVTALTFREAEPNLPLWFLILIITRDLCIVLGGVILARRTGHVAMSTWTGKIAVSMLALTMLAGVLRADQPVFEVLVWSTTALLVLSFILYTVRFFRFYRYAGSEQQPALEEDPRMERIVDPPSVNGSEPEVEPSSRQQKKKNKEARSLG